ncbi:MAG: hypothetical protein ABI784_07105 [Ginsengibacter sp.]
MQLKPLPAENTEPKHRPHPDNMHVGPRSEDEKKVNRNDKENEDAESLIRPKDFDLPKENIEDENMDDEIDKIEEANRPG